MDLKALESVALSVRSLSMDAIQAANSGHPGLPLGCAELGALIYGEILKHDPADPTWLDRDRFILSAGHGSMFLYSLLHLSGYAVTLDDIKAFRKLGSKCAGHPEYGLTPGVETTTGPLGQGIATAVGMAIAETMLAARFNTPQGTIFDHRTYVLAGDGCMMEGVAAEAVSLAGHLGLGKLVVFYDSNRITIDGGTDISFTEDTGARFAACGWQVLRGDMYDCPRVLALVDEAKAEPSKPSLIVLDGVIGKGAPSKQGTSAAHGSPLGAEEVAKAKAALGIPADTPFWAAPEAYAYFAAKKGERSARREAWEKNYAAWRAERPELAAELDAILTGGDASNVAWPQYAVGDSLATREASGKALNAACKALPGVVGGSADLAGPNATKLEGAPYSRQNRAGRMVNYGVREHAMASVSNGLALHGLRPFCATFLIFSDYLKPALRLSALMKLPVIYVFTHDSIFVGEDGPTHQPIDQLAMLRAVPNLLVLRPADAQETPEVWAMALARKDGPTALVLSRQALTVFQKADAGWKAAMRSGAYIARDVPDGKPDVVVAATGSEVGMAIDAAKKAELSGGAKAIRVLSVPSRELFLDQSPEERERLLPRGVRVVAVEAASRQGWEAVASSRGDIFAIDRFGESGPPRDVSSELKFTPDALAALLVGEAAIR